LLLVRQFPINETRKCKRKDEAREKKIKSSESINREKGRLEEAKHMNNRVLRRVF
jgi:hypothetical protein